MVNLECKNSSISNSNMKFKPLIPFIKKGLLFIIGFLALTYAMETTFNLAIRQIEVGEYGVLNKINDGNINAEILINGSSRALKAINPQIITETTGLTCYNIAADGADIGVQLPKLKWYMANNTKPKIIIQDISQFFGGISTTVFEPFKYLPYISNDSLYKGLLKIDDTFWLHKYLPAANIIYYNFDFYYKLFSELRNSAIGNDHYVNGFLPDSSNWASDFDLYKKQNPIGVKSSVEENYKLYLLELKKHCEINDIVLILTILPNYYRLAELAKNTEEISEFYSSLETIPKIYFLDFGNSSISKNEENFYNFTHLNITGANKFSELIVKEIKSLNILNSFNNK